MSYKEEAKRESLESFARNGCFALFTVSRRALISYASLIALINLLSSFACI